MRNPFITDLCLSVVCAAPLSAQATGLPAEFSVLNNYDCGVIAIWTRVTA